MKLDEVRAIIAEVKWNDKMTKMSLKVYLANKRGNYRQKQSSPQEIWEQNEGKGCSTFSVWHKTICHLAKVSQE